MSDDDFKKTNARDYTDVVVSDIVNDIVQLYGFTNEDDDKSDNTIEFINELKRILFKNLAQYYVSKTHPDNIDTNKKKKKRVDPYNKKTLSGWLKYKRLMRYEPQYFIVKMTEQSKILGPMWKNMSIEEHTTYKNMSSETILNICIDKIKILHEKNLIDDAKKEQLIDELTKTTKFDVMAEERERVKNIGKEMDIK